MRDELKKAKEKFSKSATAQVESASKSLLPERTSSRVMKNVSERLKMDNEKLLEQNKVLRERLVNVKLKEQNDASKCELNKERSTGFERDKDLQRIRKERAELKEQLEKKENDITVSGREMDRLNSEIKEKDRKLERLRRELEISQKRDGTSYQRSKKAEEDLKRVEEERDQLKRLLSEEKRQ